MVLQLKRQLCGAQRPPSHHPWRNLWPPGGLLRVLCFNHLRAGGPALAGPCLPHFTWACCVYTCAGGALLLRRCTSCFMAYT